MLVSVNVDIPMILGVESNKLYSYFKVNSPSIHDAIDIYDLFERKLAKYTYGRKGSGTAYMNINFSNNEADCLEGAIAFKIPLKKAVLFIIDDGNMNLKIVKVK